MNITSHLSKSKPLKTEDITRVSKNGHIAFLYNHEAGHQVRHSAAVIPQLLKLYPKIKITILATSDPLMHIVRQVCGDIDLHRCSFIKLETPKWHKPFAYIADTIMPFSRVDHLYSNRSIFQSFDAIIVTEGTSLFLRKLKGLEHAKIIRIDHGAGDRSIGFKPSFAGNNLVLFAGSKQRDRYLNLGYLSEEQMEVVGYPKFDSIKTDSLSRSKLFSDDKPVVLYNPHPEPYLSSWYTMGLEVLEYFSTSKDYNLIFAPHIMMFLRRIHISSEHFAFRLRRDIPERYFNCSNIHVDIGSAASLDMTYTLAADIYIGDVSSQVYEFLIRPRPCIFLNSHKAKWQEDPNYLFWKFGPVITCSKDLDFRLRSAWGDHAKYKPLQKEEFKLTFDHQSTPASVRAANAIAKFLNITVDSKAI